jgi:hypothetical protein
MKTLRIATLAAVMAGAAVGLASPASADLLDGTYDRTGDGPAGSVLAGPRTVVFTSCGTGCKNMAGSLLTDEVIQFHLDGKTWTGTDSSHDELTIDNVSLTGTETSTFLRDPVHFTYVKAG